MPHIIADLVRQAKGEGYAEGYDKAEKQLHADLGALLSDPTAEASVILHRVRRMHDRWGGLIADRGAEL
jgi:hypothetical protein